MIFSFSRFSISDPVDPIRGLVVKTSFRSGMGRLVSGRNLVIIWSYRTPPISNRSSPVLSAITSCYCLVEIDHQGGSQAKQEGGFNGRVGEMDGGKGLDSSRQLKSSLNWIQITQLFVSECLKVVRMCDKIMAWLKRWTGERIWIVVN